MPTSLMTRLSRLVTRNMAFLIAAGIVFVVALLVAIPVASSAAPGFFGRYHDFSQDYSTLQTSAHKGLPCTSCHPDQRGPLVHDLAVTADFYASLIPGRQKSAIFTTFTAPTNEACLACHRTDWSDEASRTAKVPHPAHLRVAAETRSCVQCHKWTGHDEVTAKKHQSMPFSGVCVAYGCHVGTKQTSECQDCHHSLDTTGTWKVDHPKAVQTVGANGCLENCHDISQCRQCHTTGTLPKVAGVPVQTGLEAIQAAHVRSDWLQQHGTFAQADESQCMKCHVTDSECKACHAIRPAFHGSTATWIGQHQKVAKGNESRCTAACHAKSFCDDCHKQFKEMQ